MRRPFPQHLGYGAIVPDRWSQDELDDHVRAAYERWKANYVVSAERSGDQLPRFRVAFGKPESGNHGTTVSEGQGFGMIAVAHMAGHDPQAQAIFDGLWRFTRDHPSAIDARLMDWRVPDRNGNASAFDGDCDMAYGLLLADAQWGSDGAVDYRAEFNRLIGGILASTIGPQSRLPMLGDWVTPNGAMHNQYSPRTSDFMPGHFRAFRRATGDSVWDEVIAACGSAIDRLQEHFSPQTGLLPDFVEPASSTDRLPRPASPGFLEGPYDGAYRYNAGRDPWRLGVDALLSGDRSSASRARKMSQWAMGATQGDVHALRAGYELNGTPLPGSTYFTTFFAAPLGVAAMTDATAQAWVNDIYAAVHDRSEGYYEDSVTLLCLLAMTGNWWSPD